MHRILVLWMVALTPTSSLALSAQLSSTALYPMGSSVTLRVQATGTVHIESSLSNSSQSVEIIGTKDVDVGKVTGPSFATILLTQDKQVVPLQLLFIPDAGNKLSVSQLPGAALPAKPKAEVVEVHKALAKFVSQLDKARLKTALGTAFKPWIATNGPGWTGTGTICAVALAYTPALGACIGGVADSLASLAGAVLIQSARDLGKAGKLTAAEVERLAQLFDNMVFGSQLLLGSDSEKILSALSSALEASVQDDKWKVVIKVTFDQAKKGVALVHLKKIL